MSLNFYKIESNPSLENIERIRSEIISLINNNTSWSAVSYSDSILIEPSTSMPGFVLTLQKYIDGDKEKVRLNLKIISSWANAHHPFKEVNEDDVETAWEPTYHQPIQLIVVNGGDIFELRIPYFFDPINFGIIRGARIKSSLNNQEYILYNVLLDDNNINNIFYGDWWSSTGTDTDGYIIIPSNASYKILHPQFSSGWASFYGEEEKDIIQLMPTILPFFPSNDLGCPTIGNQKVYTIVNKKIQPYTEFIVNQQKFVSIGSDLAIPSI